MRSRILQTLHAITIASLILPHANAALPKWLCWISLRARPAVPIERPLTPDEAYFSALMEPRDEFDPVRRLYRGSTGSETDGQSYLFLTDDPEVANTYVKNGGAVDVYELPVSGIYELQARGHLTTFEDMHVIDGAQVRHFTYRFEDRRLKRVLRDRAIRVAVP